MKGGNKNKGDRKKKKVWVQGRRGTARLAALTSQSASATREQRAVKAGSAFGATKAATKASDIETPKDEHSEHCDGA